MKPIIAHDGFILIMTLLLIALATIMTTVMFDRGNSYVPFAQISIDRQKAIFLAYSGLEIVQSQLLGDTHKQATKQKTESEKLQQQKKQPAEEQEGVALLRAILPHLNRWQTFTLHEDHDGIDGVLRICIMSEEGKLNINKLYDFKTKKFTLESKQDGEIKAVLATLFANIEKNIHAKDLVQALEQFLQKRDYPLNDVTELLTIKAFEPFKNVVYYAPSSNTSGDQKKSTRVCALTDLFTTYSSGVTLDPWVLSESLRTVLNIPPSPAIADAKYTQTVDEVLQQFKLSAEWQQDWDTSLKLLYGIEFGQLPKQVGMLFRKSGEPRYFSVLIYSTVGDTTQQLYVILERIKKSQDTKTVYQIVVQSYYWL